VTVAGNIYEGGIIASVDPIKYSARIVGGGGIATRDAVSITLNDKTKELHRTLQQLDIEGRDVAISRALFPLNLLRNSGFESPTSGSDFDFWTETQGHASNAIARETTIKRSGAQSAKLTCGGSPGPKILSAAVTVRQGTTISASFYARAGAAGDVVRAYVRVNGLFWNSSTRVLQISSSFTAFTPSASQFDRFTIEGIFHAAWDLPEQHTVTIEFEVPTIGDIIYLDDVQLEGRLRASSYHAGRYDMAASDLLSVYWGEVRDPKWDDGTIKLQTKSIMNRRHRTIPATRVTAETVPGFVIPPDNIGRPFPVTFGEFLFDHVGLGEIFPSRVAAAGILVNAVANTDPITAYFDAPTHAVSFQRIYHYGSDSKRFYRERIDTSAGNASEWVKTNSQAKIESVAGANYLEQGLVPLSLLLFAVSVGNNGSFTDQTFAADADLATKAFETRTTINAVDFGFRLQKPDEFSGLEAFAAYAIGKVQAILNSGTATRNITMRATPNTGSIKTAVMTTGAMFDAVPNAAPEDANEMDKPFTLDDASKQVSWWLSPDNYYAARCEITAGSTPNVTFELYALGIRLDVAIAIEDWLPFASMLGRAFGDTWGGRKTAASVIYDQAEVLEAILRHELGVTTAEINTGSFDAAVSDGLTLIMAGQITEIQESIEVIEDLAFHTAMLYYVDGDGKEAVRTLKHGSTVRTLTPSDFVDGSIECQFTKREELFTDYILHYARIHGEDTYVSHIFCNRNDSNIGNAAYETKCAAAYAALGNRENPKEYWCNWANDQTSARNILKWLIDWNRARRRRVTAEAFSDQLDLELGDRVDLQLGRYLLERDTDTPRPVFVLESSTIEAGRVDLQFLEVIAP
jgi:hypothetical protein